VEATLDVDGKPVTLKKTFKEKWTKKRGSPNSTLTGHTTEHSIDGVPVKKKDWDKRIGELIQEDTFKLLTSPTYFNQLHWQKRRQILLDVCGDVTDQAIIESNADLAKLPEILGNRSLEDHKKVVTSKKKEINKRLQEIPARIDELSRCTQAADQYSPRMIKDQIKELEGKIEQVKAEGQTPEIQRRLRDIQAEVEQLKNDDARVMKERYAGLKSELAELSRERTNQSKRLEDVRQRLKEIEQSRDRWNSQIEKLRNEYRELAAQEASVDGKCPTCGQDLPEDQVQAARDKFNQDKAARLKEINAEGAKKKTAQDQATQEIVQLSQEVDALGSEIADLDKKIYAKQIEIDQANQQPGPNAHKIADLENTHIPAIKTKLEEAQPQTDTSALEQELEAERTKLAQVDAAKQSKARIEELKAEEKRLAGEYEDLEQQTYLMEQFERSRAEMLNEKINSRFEMARFKLFEEQINGGVNETCETLYQGVPYGSGLNNGARINVGLDIIRTLSEHYGVKVPVFVDNAEAVTELIDPGTQTIRLVVDGNYQELTIENQNTYAEAING
jgi:myosin heavy subunit